MSNRNKRPFENLESRRLFSAGVAPFGAGSNGVPADWQATFVDDFEGNSLDTSKWFVRDGMRWTTDRTKDSRPNITSPSSVSVAGGDLKLTVHSTSDAHNSGWIQTKRRDTDGVIADDVNDTKFEQSFGYWESRIKFSNGLPGAWQAFWVHAYTMEGTGGAASVIGTEMDVVESALWGGWTGTPSLVKSTIHWNGYTNGSSTAVSGNVSGTVADYHVYGLKWTATSVTFYVDGQMLGQPVTNPAAISQIRHGMILSNEVTTNAGWAGTIPTSGYGTLETSNTFMNVDYVKVWGDPTAPPPRTPVPNPNPDPDPTPDPTPVPTTPTTISGQLFFDANRNGTQNGGEVGLAGRIAYIDLNNDGVLAITEPRGTTNGDGFYVINDVPTNATYLVRQSLPPAWTQTRPTAGLALSISLAGGAGPVTGVNFGSWTAQVNNSTIGGSIGGTPTPRAPVSTKGAGVLTRSDLGTRKTTIILVDF